MDRRYEGRETEHADAGRVQTQTRQTQGDHHQPHVRVIVSSYDIYLNLHLTLYFSQTLTPYSVLCHHLVSISTPLTLSSSYLSFAHSYSAEEVQELVERRRKAAVISGTQNKAQFRIKLNNDMAVQQSLLETALTKLDKVREQGGSELELEEQVSKVELKMSQLREELRLIEQHTAEALKAYSAADKLSNVNKR